MDLIDRMDEIVSNKGLLSHPFYQAWNEGKLEMDSLKEYAVQYYHFEKSYPIFLSGLHYRCQDQEVRQHILQNLWDEEYGPDNHVELWLRFCDALGLERDLVKYSVQSEATSQLITTYKRLTAEESLVAGASALYAYESQVPEVARTKINGLEDFYDISDERAISFFTTHELLDIEHSDAEREMVLSLCNNQDDDQAAIQGTKIASEALWSFLDGIEI